MAERIVGQGETYVNLKALEGVVQDGDIVSITDTATIDDSTNSVDLRNVYFTMRSHPNNTQSPTVQLSGGSVSLKIGNSSGEININDIKFYAENVSGQPIGNYSQSDLISYDSCEFYAINANSQVAAFLFQDGAAMKVSNCLFHDLPGGAFRTGGKNSVPVTLVNNVAYNNGRYGNTIAIFELNFYGSNLIVLNNIVEGNDRTNVFGMSGEFAGSGYLSQDYNCLHGCLTEYGGDFTSASHNIDSTQTPGANDPKLRDPENADFRLQSSSPCIDAGIGPSLNASVPTSDFIDTTRSGSTTDMGAYENLFATSAFNQSTATKNQTVISTIEKSSLISKIQEAGADTYFDSQSELHSVAVRYTHDGNRQKKTILHTGAGLTGTTSWGDNARDGTWEKDRIISTDTDGAQNTILRATIGSDEDIVMSDGTATLNT